MVLKNISLELEAHLPQNLLYLLKEIGEIAEARDESAYLVGGVVRDLLLGRRNYDFDLVVEGDAIALARRIAKEKNWSVRTHPRFRTAKLQSKDFILDLVTARSENYARPGFLPTVEAGTIQDDLCRRDFTINAIAVCLSPGSFGELLDPHGGLNDLEKARIRILHRGSFSDDPTRILRALRYEQRLGFHLQQEAEQLIGRHLNDLDVVTGERLWHEMDLILREEHPEKVLCRASELGVLQKLYPALKGDEWLAEQFALTRNIGDVAFSMPSIYLALVVYRLTQDESEGFIARLKMPGWAARTVRGTVKLRQSLSSLSASGLRPRDIYHHLERYMPEVVKAGALASDSSLIRQRLDLYLDRLRFIKPLLSGDDLQRKGIGSGKKVGRVLRALHDARLDGDVAGREEEEALVQRLLVEGGG